MFKNGIYTRKARFNQLLHKGIITKQKTFPHSVQVEVSFLTLFANIFQAPTGEM